MDPERAAEAVVRTAVADAHRREWAYVLAATARVAGDLDLAEECVQDAYLAALDAWTRQGVPDRPGAWLTTTARRRALDLCRRQRTLRDKLPLLIEPAPHTDRTDGGDMYTYDGDDDGTAAIPDDRLRLIFTCCHPALGVEAQIALTLRLVCGLTTRQIAQAFLVSEATMAARVTRAKKKIAAARIPYRVPAAGELPDRLNAVLAVVHLVYTTGHTDPTGAVELTQRELTTRAIDLARLLLALMPDEREVRGLLALLLLTDARGATRTDEAGRLVLLEDQDRDRWDRAAIDEGAALVADSLRGAGARTGRYAVQAAIAALHSEARTYQETDWPQIVRLYDVLARLWPSPVVALNRAVARAMAEGPEAGLADIEDLERDGALAGYRYLPAAKADLLRRQGRIDEAAQSYREALALTEGAVERNFLQSRLDDLTVRTSSP